jgi:hypothetical protein
LICASIARAHRGRGVVLLRVAASAFRLVASIDPSASPPRRAPRGALAFCSSFVSPGAAGSPERRQRDGAIWCRPVRRCANQVFSSGQSGYFAATSAVPASFASSGPAHRVLQPLFPSVVARLSASSRRHPQRRHGS